jgi:hypothetical protein
LLTVWARVVYRVDERGWVTASYEIPQTAGSKESFHFLQDRFENCVRNHSECMPKSQKWTPTRLMYIGSQTSEVRLSVNHPSVEYIALSYCWGGVKFFQTTLVEYDSLTENIKWSNLPQVFQDAVTVAYTLGFQYIWIDSICIVQDSVTDWAQESARMADVYTHASLTIASKRLSCSITKSTKRRR